MARCPSCDWEPRGADDWRCSACEERYDRIRTGACCPCCAWSRSVTRCPHCEASAPHEDWLDPDERAAWLQRSREGPQRILRKESLQHAWNVTKHVLAAEPSAWGDLPQEPQRDLRGLRQELLAADDAIDRLQKDLRSLSVRLEAAVDRPALRRELSGKMSKTEEELQAAHEARAKAHQVCELAGWIECASQAEAGPDAKKSENRSSISDRLNRAGSWVSPETASSLERWATGASGALSTARQTLEGMWERMTADDTGKAQLDQGDYKGAIRAITRTMVEEGGSALLHHRRGTAHYQLGNYDAAVADLAAAKLRNPQPWPLTLLAWARFALNDYEGAIAECSQALELDPKHAGAHSCRGYARQTLGKLLAAMEDFEEASRIEPDRAEHLCVLANALTRLGRHSEARERADAAVELCPMSRHCLRERAEACSVSGDFARAIADGTRALRLDPELPTVRFTRGVCRLLQGELELAEQDFTVEQSVFPEAAQSWLYRGFARWLRGDRARARADLRRAVEVEKAGCTTPYLSKSLPWMLIWLSLLDEEPELLVGVEDRASSARKRAVVHLARGDHDLAKTLEIVDETRDPEDSTPELTHRTWRIDAHTLAGLRGPESLRAEQFEIAVTHGPLGMSTYQFAKAWLAVRPDQRPAPATAPTDVEWTPQLLDALERLAALRGRGLLSAEEFQGAKRQLLAEHSNRARAD